MSKLVRFLSRRRTGKGIKRGVQQTDPKKNKHVINCNVVLLDGTDVSIELPKSSLGDVLYQRVFYHLDLLETSYFGLQFTDSGNVNHWLDPTKKIKKQIPIGPPYTLRLRVKFFPTEPSALKEELTRYQFFLQCKTGVLNGSLPCPDEAMAIELSALALQSELGDFDEEEHTPAFISEFRFIPNQTEEMEMEIYSKYQSLRGQRMTPDKAELQYLHKVKWLDMYGVDMHYVLGRDGLRYKLGLTPTGVLVFEGEEKIGLFYWPKITKFNFKRRKLILVVVEDCDSQETNEQKQEHTFVFRTENPKACKHLWKCAIEHHTFFRVVVQPHTERHKQGFIRLGSRFRYSGRTQFEQLNKSQARRSVRFERQPSKRFSRRQSLEARDRMKRRRPPGLAALSAPTTSLDNGALATNTSPNGAMVTAGVTSPNGISSAMDRLDNLIASSDKNGTLKSNREQTLLEHSEAAQAKIKGLSDTPEPPPRPVKDVNLYQNNQVKMIGTKEKVPIEIKSNILKARADEERQSISRSSKQTNITNTLPKVVVMSPTSTTPPPVSVPSVQSPTGEPESPIGGAAVMQEDNDVLTEDEDDSVPGEHEVFLEDFDLLPRQQNSSIVSPVSPVSLSHKEPSFNGSRLPRNASTSSNKSKTSPTSNKTQPSYSRDDKSPMKPNSASKRVGQKSSSPQSDDSVPLIGSPKLGSPTHSNCSAQSSSSAQPEVSSALSPSEEEPSYENNRSQRPSTTSRQDSSMSNGGGEILITNRPTPAPRKYEKRVCVTTEL